MKVRTSELTDRVLNHAVHLALGYSYRNDDKYGPMYMWPSHVKGVTNWENWPANYCNDWAQGGPIIDREGIGTRPDTGLNWWVADIKGGAYIDHGPTALIAAMRCFVASKLDDEVEVPEELV